MTEQIRANQLRFYQETDPGSGVPDGDVLEIPTGPSAISRQVVRWGRRSDVFRNPSTPTPIHETFEGRFSMHPSREFLAWILALHGNDAGTSIRFDRQAADPTFCLEVQTENGDSFRFVGLAISEFQLIAEARRVVSLEIQFFALDREAGTALSTPTIESMGGGIVPSTDVTVSWRTDPASWGADPIVDDRIVAFSFQLYFRRRGLRPVMFAPTGRATRYQSAPWRVMAELRTDPDSDLARTSKSRIQGGFRLFIGQADPLEFLADAVSGFAEADPVKAQDFREETILIEAAPGPSGKILEMIDNGNA